MSRQWLGKQADLGVQRVRADAAPGDFNDVTGQGSHKYVWQMPIPLYDLGTQLHRELIELAARAEQVASAVDLLSSLSKPYAATYAKRSKRTGSQATSTKL